MESSQFGRDNQERIRKMSFDESKDRRCCYFSVIWSSIVCVGLELQLKSRRMNWSVSQLCTGWDLWKKIQRTSTSQEKTRRFVSRSRRWRGSLWLIPTDDCTDQDISSERVDDANWSVQLTGLSDWTHSVTMKTQGTRDTMQLSSPVTWRLSFSRLSWWVKETEKFWRRRCIVCKRWCKAGNVEISRPRRLQCYKSVKEEFAGQWKAIYEDFSRSCRDTIFRDDRENGINDIRDDL